MTTDKTPDQPAKPDGARKQLSDCAVACLDHVQRVRWGRATSQYILQNYDGLKISVSITVECFEKGADNDKAN